MLQEAACGDVVEKWQQFVRACHPVKRAPEVTESVQAPWW